VVSVARELVPGVFTSMFTTAGATVVAKIPLALAPVALAVETEAKRNASNGEHAYRTPTPARPGSGPARISGTLVRSITHSGPTVTAAGGVSVRVGPEGGLYSPHNRRTPSSKYGMYLEKGMLRNGNAYPFLVPAFHKVAVPTARASFGAVFRGAIGFSV
jgi:hypothetical protein